MNKSVGWIAGIMMVMAVFGGGYTVRDVVIFKDSNITPAPTPVLVYVDSLNRYDMIDLVNKSRLENGLNKLKENTRLNFVAHEKACDMYDKKYFDHMSPDGVGMLHWASMSQLSWDTYGENIAQYHYKDSITMDSFIKSASHSANILDKRFTDIGIGRCFDYLVQHFAEI